MSQVSEELRELVRNLEGFSSTAYVDAHGHSIGYGHLIRPGEEHLLSQSITEEEAEGFLEGDILSHQVGFKQHVVRPLSSNQEAALTSLAYNLGPHSKALTRIVKLHNEGKDQEAAEVFHEYNKSYNPAKGVKEVNSALVQRRAFESELFTSPDHTDLKEAHGRYFGKNRQASRPVNRSVQIASQGLPLNGGDLIANENARALQGLIHLNAQLKANADDALSEAMFMERLRREGSGL